MAESQRKLPDREKVIAALEKACRDSVELPPFAGIIEITKEAIEEGILPLLKEQVSVAANHRDEVMRSWRLIKFSAVETANYNAGPEGNEDVYRILTWVATMMDNQEKEWNDA